MNRSTVLRQLRGAALGLALLGAALLLPPASLGQQQPPAPPADLQALAVSVGEVALQWRLDAPMAVYGYTIRRNSALLATLYGDVRSYRDTSVQPSTNYTYTVTLLTTTWEEASSTPAMVKTPALPETPDTTPPSPPHDLDSALVGGAVLLDWQDASDDSDISAYLIRRDGLEIALVNSGTLSYSDTLTLPDTTYIYSVEALDIVGHHSPPSNLEVATTGPVAYPAP